MGDDKIFGFINNIFSVKFMEFPKIFALAPSFAFGVNFKALVKFEIGRPDPFLNRTSAAKSPPLERTAPLIAVATYSEGCVFL